MFVKRLPNDFSEISYPNEYWPEKYFLYLNIQLADEVSFDFCFEDRSLDDFFVANVVRNTAKYGQSRRF